MLVVSMNQLQAQLSLVVNAALETMRAMLIVAARSECARVLAHFQDHARIMSERPTDLHGFAGFLENVMELQTDREAFMGEAKLVDDMYNMLVQYEAKVPENDRLVVDDLKDIIVTFNKARGWWRKGSGEAQRMSLAWRRTRFDE